jgi:hypothetical protein
LTTNSQPIQADPVVVKLLEKVHGEWPQSMRVKAPKDGGQSGRAAQSLVWLR